jgi:ABC-type sugar transport system ATPase subunit
MLEARGIGKSYGGVVALRGANLTVRPGSVHALLGENGAGKSTLVKIIAGAIRLDEGSLLLDGAEVSFSSTADAARHGVAVVSQELSLFPHLDLLNNLFPMREPRRGPFIDRSAMVRRARPVLDSLGISAPLRQPVGALSLAERQLVEIAKALVAEPRVLILDEPTSALAAGSTERLMRVLRALRERQVAVVFVSHILEEVMALCDEITVLRDGLPVLEGVATAEMTVPGIVAAMLGERAHGRLAARPEAADAEAGLVAGAVRAATGSLVLDGVSAEDRLHGVSFTVRPGEIVGAAGLAGSGHLALLEVLSGQRRLSAGSVTLPNGRPVPRGLRNAVAAGVALVTGDRRRFGLMLDKPLWENIGQVRAVALARDGLIVRKRRLRQRAGEHVERLGVRTSSTDARGGELSGGNQQKVVFAKWLDAEPSVLLLDDPTRGVDVGAKEEMHRLIRGAAHSGAIVLLNSTDLDELSTLCDRVCLFYAGRLCAELSGSRLTVHDLLETINTGVVPEARAV